MSQHLKPCPFCGYPPVLAMVHDDLGHERGWQVSCEDAHCSVVAVTLGLGLDKDRATEAWNKRYDVAAAAGGQG